MGGSGIEGFPAPPTVSDKRQISTNRSSINSDSCTLGSGGRVVVNDDVLRALYITRQQLRDVAEREGREMIRREAAYRGAVRPST